MPGSQAQTDSESVATSSDVLCCSQLQADELETVAKVYGVEVVWLADGVTIRGSYWGEREAGLVGNKLYVRGDTPVHSALHELCHYVCMPPATRRQLDTNAGGDYDEENGVCYLQIRLADSMPSCSSQRMLRDMDSWGYTFRLGSASAWFHDDAEDAREWLEGYGLVTQTGVVTGALREQI
ncbi:MAG: hypothetical protein AB8G18_14885 [Gammaproteobacteria bacterium]